MKIPFDRSCLRSALERMDIADIAQATIRQSGDIARTMERDTGVEFLHLEMGVPGLPPERAGVEAECAALQAGVASQYPNMFGIPELKTQASRFLKAFLDVEVAPRGCIPTVGSMQAASPHSCSARSSTRSGAKSSSSTPDSPCSAVRYAFSAFPRSRSTSTITGAKSWGRRSRASRRRRRGGHRSLNPNNPAWICLTEDELRTIGELATRYDAIVIKDLAYLCMDFRKPLGRPFEAPYQASVARYTDNYILLVSGSKIFSYAGQRIAVAAISDALFRREYPALRRRYNIGRLGDAYVLVFLYAASSGTSHSAQHALAAMFRAAADGELDFVGEASEYARRARLTKETFLRHGFRIVYDKRTATSRSATDSSTRSATATLTSAELLSELLPASAPSRSPRPAAARAASASASRR